MKYKIKKLFPGENTRIICIAAFIGIMAGVLNICFRTTVHLIDLTPDEGKSYYKVGVVIDKAKDQLLEITIYDKNGSTYSYIISSFIPNLELEDSQFTFNAEDYPDVDIVDMR